MLNKRKSKSKCKRKRKSKSKSNLVHWLGHGIGPRMDGPMPPLKQWMNNMKRWME